MRSKRILAVLITIVFCIIWFVPIPIGWHGEVPYCRFRFQVFEYQQHDYNQTSWKDIFFRTQPHKYFSFEFTEKVGGAKTYFGLESLPFELTDN